MTFEIHIRTARRSHADAPHGISIRANDRCLTRLLRGRSNAEDAHLEAPPARLAFWLTDNWWRLRWESVPSRGMTPEWRLSHDLSSIGGGLAWPRLAIWGEGERIGLSAQSDPPGIVGPVRFIEDALLFLPAKEWERGVDEFLQLAIDEERGFGSDRAALGAQVEALHTERADEDLASWRRVEARLGFDVDQAPEELMELLSEVIRQFDEPSVEEAIQAAPGVDAGRVLEQELEAARASRLVCDFEDAVDAAGPIEWRPNTPAWVPGEQAARLVRDAAGLPTGTLRNRKLAEILGASSAALGLADNPPALQLPYGLRLSGERANRTHKVALKSRYSHDRRFDLARALGDAIWSRGTAFGPIARTKTDRQRFQRSFAQSLLCPFDDLNEFLGSGDPDDEEIMAAAQHFHVNIRVIETTLVKKSVLSPNRFEDMIEAA